MKNKWVVFDMDGTLYGERFPTYFNDWLFIQRALYDESFEAPAYLKAFARSWEDKVLKGIPVTDFDALERELGPKLYEGLTPEAYAEVVRSFKELPVRGFTGMTGQSSSLNSSRSLSCGSTSVAIALSTAPSTKVEAMFNIAPRMFSPSRTLRLSS